MATTTRGIPYVEPTDNPLDYPEVSQQLAELLEIRLPKSGTVLAAFTAVNTNSDTVVTFPIPYPTTVADADVAVNVTPVAGQTGNTWAVLNITRTGFTLRAKRDSGTASVTYNYTAQVVS